MNNRWSESIKNNILDLMPSDGSPVKAGIIYKKSKLSTVTVSKYLSVMVDEGIIERVSAKRRELYILVNKVEKHLEEYFNPIKDLIYDMQVLKLWKLFKNLTENT